MCHRIVLICIHYKNIFRVNACPPQSTFRSCVKTISRIRVFWDKTIVLLRDLFLFFLWHNIWYIYYLMSCSHSPDFLGFDSIIHVCVCVCVYDIVSLEFPSSQLEEEKFYRLTWGRKIHWIFCYHFMLYRVYLFLVMSSALFSFEDSPPQFVWLYSFWAFTSY